MAYVPLSSNTRRAAFAALLALASAGCHRRAPAAAPALAPSPAASSATSSATIEPAAPPGVERRGYTAADVGFMQRMIAHHAQALWMAALVPMHTTRANMKLLAERIDVSQRDEIAFMRRWLAERHEVVPSGDPHEMHHDDMAGMPGMLTMDEMTRLESAHGADFDRLFLEDMIRHHQGALTMAGDLLARPAAAQEPEIFRFASDVDADQRAEIARMRALLGAGAE